ncbi:SID1 transmembrane family [Trichuris trichiura]|uniref:SID1 transmembrane family n=2 Tax=Trichuris trichiura TaxID=36087 RepID=A0A077ZFN8_TRITR|nr:SID1 transmembrane family [Trichuris trichiura]
MSHPRWFYGFLCVLLAKFEAIHSQDVPWYYDEEYVGEIGAGGSGYLRLVFPQNRTSGVVRVTVRSLEASMEKPLLIVARESKTILSWQLPLLLENKFQYNVASRTLCPDFNETQEASATLMRPLYIELSTNSPAAIGFTVVARLIENFHLNFPEDVEYVNVRVESNDYDCMIVSVQPIQCPVFDLDTNVKFLGMYQTTTKKASLTVHREKAERVHVVFVVKANPYDCSHVSRVIPTLPVSDEDQTKSFNVTIETLIKFDRFGSIILVTLSVYIAIYFVVFVFWLIFYCRDERRFGRVRRDLIVALETDDCPGTTSSNGIDNYGAINRSPSKRLSTDEADDSYDNVDDASKEKLIVRTKVNLVVADLARKPYKQNNKKYSIYPCALTFQEVFTTGNQDMCYYNFECAHPFLGLIAFNNVFSNVGYVLLGILFLILVGIRDAENQRVLSENPSFQARYGIPKHFGLFYAMGMALILEGILSGCYHVCPNYSNFQFDTAFMYMIAALCMLKIYQIRHPDINANSHVAYFVMALIILLAVVGVVYSGLPFWITFTIFYAVLIFLLSAEFYYKGQWKINRGSAVRIARELFCVRKSCRWFCPTYPDRMCFLLVGNVLNWGFIIFGMMKQPGDFPLFLVVIFISNLMLYLLFYVSMKLRHREHLNGRVLVIGTLSGLSWGFSLFFFLDKQLSWRVTAAQSRELNGACLIAKFYDAHDIWHFLSAISMFLSFLILLVIDDDLVNTAHDQIPVF